MAEIKKYLDTTALGALVDKIKAEDAKVLAAAQKYTDDAGKLYDGAGSAATAESNAKAYTDELANGQVKTNKEAIAVLNGEGEGSVKKAVADAKAIIDGDIDAVEAKADKNAEDIAAINNAETGILAQAKSHTDTEVGKVQGELDALEVVVQNIQENAYDDSEIRGILADKADKTQVAEDIAAAVKVETDARVEAISGVQAAANAAQTAADKAQEEVDALEQAHATDKAALEAKDAELQEAIDAEVERATGVEAGLEGRIETMEAFWEAAQADGTDSNVIDTLKEIQEYIVGDETGASEMAASIKQNADAIAAMDTAYKAADGTLQGNIDALTEVVNGKAAASDVETLTGRVDGIDESIEALEQADAGQVERIAALEAKFGEGEGSVEDLIADAVADGVADAVAQAEAKDAEILAQAKKYADDEDAKIEARVAELETASATHALKTEVEAVAGRVGTLETDMTQAKTDIDVVEALAAANEAAIKALQTASATHALQSDLDSAVARIAVNEGAIVTINESLATKADADDLEGAIERIAANEAGIAENKSAINSFTAITSDEVNALFA